MTGLWAIYRREMLSLWVTPLAWVLLVVFLLLEGGIFYSITLHYATLPDPSADSGPLQAFFGEQTVLLLLTLILLCPALSMRLFAEERRSGTLETLLTAPVDASAVVRQRMATQRLTSAPLDSAAAVVRLLLGVQSQERDHALWSLAMRTRAATFASSTSIVPTSGTSASVLEMVIRTVEPSSSFCPGGGRCSRMVPPGRGLSTHRASSSKPASCRMPAAAKSSRSTMSGTGLLGGDSVSLA